MFAKPAIERAILSSIFHHGRSAYLDVVGLVDSDCFFIDENRDVFQCFQQIFAENENIETVDIPTILAFANRVRLAKAMTESFAIHLEAIEGFTRIDEGNVRRFAACLRKLKLASDLHGELGKARTALSKVDGNESVADILAIPENALFQFLDSNTEHASEPKHIAEAATEHLRQRRENPVDQVGVPTGFAYYDRAIGGGLRPGASLMGARMKVGKTTLLDNIAMNITKLGIPVLNMDTEMSFGEHIDRIVALMTGIKINDIETGKFSKSKSLDQQVTRAEEKFIETPYYHEYVGGMAFEEHLAIMRRWVMRHVGLNDDGTAKPCVILYDYIKFLKSSRLDANTAEHQLLGYMATTLHDFGIKFQIPILTFVQLNRVGIDSESSDAIAGSDRIGQICTNFAMMKIKTAEEIAADGAANGNRKMVVVHARHGAATEMGDYVNIQLDGEVARIKELNTKLGIESERGRREGGFDISDEDTEF